MKIHLLFKTDRSINLNMLRRTIHKNWKRFLKVSACGVCLTLFSYEALAWGAQGHQVIANLAQGQLTPRARQEVDRLLALEPGETLASISTWADEHRNPATAGWHFVNFPRDSCAFDPSRDCAGGQCVVGAIDRQAEILASNASDEKRLLALKYLVHFVGDVYQPLHAGYLDDKGGNTYQLQVFKRGSNLHSLWDSGLIRSFDEDVDEMSKRLSAKRVAQKFGTMTAAQAAETSCQIVGSQGFYPSRQVGADYIERFTPVLEQQLIAAGAHLARLLNRIFSGTVR